MNLLSTFRYLLALNEHKHFGRAAAACHITQPALSNALRALEREFDVVIVKRDRNFLGLTPEGERVLASAQVMLHEASVLQQELKAGLHVPQGPLRMAAVPTAVPILGRFAAMLRARHPGIAPVVLSMSSRALEQGLDDMSIELALGYTERLKATSRLHAMAQYTEHYFLLRRSTLPHSAGLFVGAPLSWAEAARLPLCLLTREMHNRTVVDAAFASAGVAVTPAMETNSILTLILSVVAGDVCSVLPGALVSTARDNPLLEALPMCDPVVGTPIGFMFHAAARPSRALEAALTLANDDAWRRQAAAHSGLLIDDSA